MNNAYSQALTPGGGSGTGGVGNHSHGDLVLAWPSDRRLALTAGRLRQGITTIFVAPGNWTIGTP